MPPGKSEGEYRLAIFDIPKMDCPSEEGMIRMALANMPEIKKLSFDLMAHKMRVVSTASEDAVLAKLRPLNFGAKLAEARELTEVEEAIELSDSDKSEDESKVLKQLLAINGSMFVLEIVFGWIAQSTGLVADSLDMFADAAVYGLSLFAVGKALSLKQRAARLSGYLQLILALGASAEVVRRFVFGSEPHGALMIGVAAIALIANISCLLLLAKHRTGGVHMKASWIFSTNDVIANAGVIAAGVLVAFTGSPYPDLIIASIIAVVVFSGAMRILRVARVNG